MTPAFIPFQVPHLYTQQHITNGAKQNINHKKPMFLPQSFCSNPYIPVQGNLWFHRKNKQPKKNCSDEWVFMGGWERRKEKDDSERPTVDMDEVSLYSRASPLTASHEAIHVRNIRILKRRQILNTDFKIRLLLLEIKCSLFQICRNYSSLSLMDSWWHCHSPYPFKDH